MGEGDGCLLRIAAEGGIFVSTDFIMDRYADVTFDNTVFYLAICNLMQDETSRPSSSSTAPRPSSAAGASCSTSWDYDYCGMLGELLTSVQDSGAHTWSLLSAMRESNFDAIGMMMVYRTSDFFYWGEGAMRGTVAERAGGADGEGEATPVAKRRHRPVSIHQPAVRGARRHPRRRAGTLLLWRTLGHRLGHLRAGGHRPRRKARLRRRELRRRRTSTAGRSTWNPGPTPTLPSSRCPCPRRATRTMRPTRRSRSPVPRARETRPRMTRRASTSTERLPSTCARPCCRSAVAGHPRWASRPTTPATRPTPTG